MVVERCAPNEICFKHPGDLRAQCPTPEGRLSVELIQAIKLLELLEVFQPVEVLQSVEALQSVETLHATRAVELGCILC